ncbi:MAG TPA: hypothetical protein VN683_01195 [Acidothermaceae bacterium]|nr:hypothetical protein [Acidothermaceae bacterium]
MSEPSTDPMFATLRNVIDHADPVPQAVVEAARAAYTWRTIDAELAELTADSAMASAGVRSTSAPRLLTFEGTGLEVEVEVAQTGSTRHLSGQLVPMGPAQITVRWSDGTRETTADDLGRFAVDRVPAGSVSLAILRTGADQPIVTSWISI